MATGDTSTQVSLLIKMTKFSARRPLTTLSTEHINDDIRASEDDRYC